jgi:quinolinate synthase
MADVLCKCSTMNRITPRGLLWTLETIERKLRGEDVALPNVIDVPADVRRDANVALQRMLDLPPA